MIRVFFYTRSIFNRKFIFSDGVDLLPQNLNSLEETLEASYKCYEKALTLEPLEIDKNNLLRRLGNIHNELGVLYMNQAGAYDFYSSAISDF